MWDLARYKSGSGMTTMRPICMTEAAVTRQPLRARQDGKAATLVCKCGLVTKLVCSKITRCTPYPNCAEDESASQSSVVRASTTTPNRTTNTPK